MKWVEEPLRALMTRVASKAWQAPSTALAKARGTARGTADRGASKGAG